MKSILRVLTTSLVLAFAYTLHIRRHSLTKGEPCRKSSDEEKLLFYHLTLDSDAFDPGNLSTRVVKVLLIEKGLLSNAVERRLNAVPLGKVSLAEFCDVLRDVAEERYAFLDRGAAAQRLFDVHLSELPRFKYVSMESTTETVAVFSRMEEGLKELIQVTRRNNRNVEFSVTYREFLSFTGALRFCDIGLTEYYVGGAFLSSLAAPLSLREATWVEFCDALLRCSHLCSLCVGFNSPAHKLKGLLWWVDRMLSSTQFSRRSKFKAAFALMREEDERERVLMQGEGP